ncbi:MAG: Mrp/NBP35 family ATP-binding protein [Candidatus Heimdallarchaeum aukensis]|uniref:Iron-sulfur cluster carrier protein n=1 Tax=Candidatus Heimdallarchaeum aukensis TaxID=2876573 RepID=A0A9Y1BJV3_9ARCH|nr:MAG: Mrp/NBP35 family ATP-binding protein [Candidatus Heimdallarchaeum aukensis]
MELKLKSEEDQKIEETLSKIKYKIAVLSGKGGTGKTTVTVNIAQTLADKGYKVGILDADITGPNVPLMLGVENEQLMSDGNKILPIEAGNVKVVSMEFLLEDKSKAIIWRGPLKIKGLKQLIGDVAWGELDFLIVDLPPGSSDEPLSIVQTIKDLNGMVVVTTPQAVSLLDVRKSINFANVTNTPILGIVENMSGFKCEHCGNITYIFAKDGGKNVAKMLNIPFLGAVPLIPKICEAGDTGKPAVKLDDLTKSVFGEIVTKMLENINKEK